MPKLMNDSSDKDGHAETIMDYVISWCLRRAQSICKKEKPILYSKCRYMLSKLLNLDTLDLKNIEFTRVEVWKQCKHSKKCTFYTLRFGCSFAAVNTIKPQLL